MKNQLSILVLSLCALSATAQPILTASTCNPQLGDVYTYYTVNSVVNPGNAGANVNWNFNTLPQFTYADYTYGPCSADPNCSSFPGTTIICNGNSTMRYLMLDTNKQTFIGTFGGGISYHFTDPEEILHFPFTYNSTFTDTWSATYAQGNTHYESGNVVVTGDAYGTLITPAGTFNNTLRVHMTETSRDSVSVSSVVSYLRETYTWYSATDSREFLLKIYSVTSGQNTGVLTRFTKVKPTGINDLHSIAATMQCFPNPATDKLSLAFTTEQTADIRISLMDMTGREVSVIANQSFYPGNQKINYSLVGLPAGIYAVNMSINGEKTIAKKIQVL